MLRFLTCGQALMKITSETSSRVCAWWRIWQTRQHLRWMTSAIICTGRYSTTWILSSQTSLQQKTGIASWSLLTTTFSKSTRRSLSWPLSRPMSYSTRSTSLSKCRGALRGKTCLSSPSTTRRASTLSSLSLSSTLDMLRFSDLSSWLLRLTSRLTVHQVRLSS